MSQVTDHKSKALPDTKYVIGVITAMIRQRPTRPTVSDVAGECGFEALRFRRRWALTGRPPITYMIAHCRIQEAARLIDEGVKIEAVKMLLGFKSHSNFCERFKAEFLELPNERQRGDSAVQLRRREFLSALQRHR